MLARVTTRNIMRIIQVGTYNRSEIYIYTYDTRPICLIIKRGRESIIRRKKKKNWKTRKSEILRQI